IPQPTQGTLTHWLTSVEKNNKTYVSNTPKEGAQKAVLNYRLLASGDNYHLLEIELLTGRKHQIRAQLAAIGCHIKGDLKYGAKRSNPDGGISLQAHRIWFEHPVSHNIVDVTAPVPDEPLWQQLAAKVNNQPNFGQ
ncbi:MAG: RNA pseudouridine synthase, partial [Muribaculaceae bacterium]|nr:RNA pseudouridine synthase [Muribaculaceae bacterium]